MKYEFQSNKLISFLDVEEQSNTCICTAILLLPILLHIKGLKLKKYLRIAVPESKHKFTMHLGFHKTHFHQALLLIWILYNFVATYLKSTFNLPLSIWFEIFCVFIITLILYYFVLSLPLCWQWRFSNWSYRVRFWCHSVSCYESNLQWRRFCPRGDFSLIWVYNTPCFELCSIVHLTDYTFFISAQDLYKHMLKLWVNFEQLFFRTGKLPTRNLGDDHYIYQWMNCHYVTNGEGRF